MNMKERAAIYGGIAVAIVLAAGYRGPGNLAAASGETPAVRSADMKIGSCDVLAITDKLLTTDKYASVMNALRTTLDGQLQALEDEIKGLTVKLQALPQDGAEFKAGYAVYQQKGQEFQNRRQQNESALRDQSTKFLSEAYNIASATADSVGAKLGYTHIFASRPPGKKIEAPVANSPNQPNVQFELIIRTLVKAPDATDITAEVIKELKLDVAPAAGPTPATPPVPAVPVAEPKTPEKK